MREGCDKFGLAPLGLREFRGALTQLRLELSALRIIVERHHSALENAIEHDLHGRVRHRNRPPILMRQHAVSLAGGFAEFQLLRAFQSLANRAFGRRQELFAARMDGIMQYGADQFLNFIAETAARCGPIQVCPSW